MGKTIDCGSGWPEAFDWTRTAEHEPDRAEPQRGGAAPAGAIRSCRGLVSAVDAGSPATTTTETHGPLLGPPFTMLTTMTPHARPTAAAAIAAAAGALTLAGLRIASPALVFLAALAVIPLKPSHRIEPSDVTVVVAATRTPRRGAILTLLSLAALTHLADGALFVTRAVMSKHWPARTGIDVAAPLGLLAYAGLAALGAYKDVIGARVWETRRIRLAITAALAVELAHGALLGVQYTKEEVRIPERPAVDFAYFAFVATRVLVLVPLLFVLVNPRVSYVPVISDEAPATASTSLLLPPGTGAEPSTGLSALAAKDGGAYGTFNNNSAANGSGPTTRATTPVPTSKGAPKEDISLDPTWSELRQRLGRIFPYLWPSKSVSLQLLAVSVCLSNESHHPEHGHSSHASCC
jgi:hypothetical protein